MLPVNSPMMNLSGRPLADYNDLLREYGLTNINMTEWDYDPRAANVVTKHRVWPFFFWITFVLGMCGNGLVVYVFLREKTVRTVTNLYLLNLALVDILYLITTIPSTSYWSDYWPFGAVMCKLISYLRCVSMAASVLTLTAVGLDRHSAILYPVSSRQYRTVRKTGILVGFFWFSSLAISIPSLVIARDIDLNGEHVCLNYWRRPWGHKAYSLTMFIFLYLIPQGILFICYFRIGKKLWFSMASRVRLTSASMHTLRRRRGVVKMVIVVTLAFAICWLPVHVVELYVAFGTEINRIFYEIKLLAPLVPHLFIATNPIMYCFMSKTFRAHFKAACACKRLTALPALSLEDPDVAPSSRRREGLFGLKWRGSEVSHENTNLPSTNNKNIQTDTRSVLSRQESDRRGPAIHLETSVTSNQPSVTDDQEPVGV